MRRLKRLFSDTFDFVAAVSVMYPSAWLLSTLTADSKMKADSKRLVRLCYRAMIKTWMERC